MSFVPALRLLLAAALAAVLVFGSRSADAQLGGGLTISFNTQSLDRSRKPLRKELPYAISYQDCLDDNRLELQVTLSSLPDSRLEVWASRGAACSNPDERNISGECWAVYSARPDDLVWNISLSPRNIVAGYLDPDLRRVENADVSVCQAGIGSGGQDSLTFYVMMVEGEQVIAQAAPWETVVDVERPRAPENVSAGAGENRLIVKWGTSKAQDRQSYQLFCERVDGGDAGTDDASTGAGGTSGGSGNGGTSGGFGDDAGSDAATDAAVEASALALNPLQLGDGSAGTGGTGGVEGTGGDGGTDTGGEGGEDDQREVPDLNLSCPSPALVQPNPPNRYRCGSATANATEGETDRLENFQLYAVAVATVDKLGNIGPLSEIECGSPKPVTDFFEAYRNAGGDAGGGFCAIGQNPQSGALVFMLGALVMWMVRRRRAR
ncbi:MAG TPA: hypothetical protein VI072_07785 [Polyangiaceae bacterium]